jgi:antagonist of KipI
MTIRVEAPGLLTTVQDRGRTGCQHLGVSPCGAMDAFSHRVANLLVGNDPGAATLEVTLAGPRLRFTADALVALCGAELSATVAGRPLPLWRPVWLRAGALVSFGAPLAGARAYLALAGGIQAPLVLGSRSTCLAAGFGGHLGRALRTGDRLDLPPQPPPPRALGQGGAPFAAATWFVPWFRELSFQRPATLGFLPGPQWPELTEASRLAFLGTAFQVAPVSNRQGLRFQGPALALACRRELVSAPVAMGTLQLPPDGAPILLMADRQTTGGYARLGEVASVDLPAAAQLRALDAVTFRLSDPREARALLLAREERLAELEGYVKARLEDAEWGIISP